MQVLLINSECWWETAAFNIFQSLMSELTEWRRDVEKQTVQMRQMDGLMQIRWQIREKRENVTRRQVERKTERQTENVTDTVQFGLRIFTFLIDIEI